MRSRNIKPGFFCNEELVECSFPARVLFIGLWCLADRAGYLEDRPKKIKIQIFPADPVDCDALMSELDKTKLIRRYSTTGGEYVWIPGFRAHQNPHRREKPSAIPPHPDDVEMRTGPEGERTGPGQEISDQGTTKDRPRHDQGQTQVEPRPNRARLIPDPLSLIPDSGSLKEKTLSDESDDGQPEPPEEPFYLTAKKKKLTGKRLETFEQFWDAFDYKHGKASAADSWLAIPELRDSTVAQILTASRLEAQGRQAKLNNGGTPKMAQGWLTGRRWEDEPPPVIAKAGTNPGNRGGRLQGDALLQANKAAAEEFLRRSDDDGPR